MTIEKKLSAPVNMLAGKLRTSFTDVGTVEGSTLSNNMSAEQLNDFLDGYKTTVLGEERTVTHSDILAVGNFREDFRQAHRLVGSERSYDHFKDNADGDRFIVETNLTDSLRFSTATYRPGSEDAGSENDYTAVVDHGDLSDDHKNITKHLEGLRKSFAGGDKKKSAAA